MNNWENNTNRCINKLSKFGSNKIRDELNILYHRPDVTPWEKDYITKKLYKKLSQNKKKRNMVFFGQTTTPAVPTTVTPTIPTTTTPVVPTTTTTDITATDTIIPPTTPTVPATTTTTTPTVPTTTTTTVPATTQVQQPQQTLTSANYNTLAQNLQNLENAAQQLTDAALNQPSTGAAANISGFGYDILKYF